MNENISRRNLLKLATIAATAGVPWLTVTAPAAETPVPLEHPPEDYWIGGY